MYAINEGQAKINGVMVETFEREVIEEDTVLRVEAGTTGYRGGERDQGGRTYLCIDCLYGDFFFSPVTDDKKKVVGIEIACSGDDGMNAIMKAIEFIHKAINDQRCEADD